MRSNKQVQDDTVAAELARVLSGLRRTPDARVFLDAILTSSERARLLSRWRLVCLLESGMCQRAVARTLGVSLCKITRGSRELKHGPSGFRSLVRRVLAVGRRSPGRLPKKQHAQGSTP